MVTDFISALFRQFKSSTKPRDRDDHEDIVLWARQRFASDFPNPAREDCPDPESLRTLVNRNEFPDADLKTHLLSCSNCFSEYRTALAGQHSSAAVPATVAKPAFGRISSFAFALLFVILSVVGVILWSRRDRYEQHVRQLPQATESPAATPTPSTTNEGTQRVEVERPTHELLAVNTVNIDLGAFQQSREPSSNNRRVIKLKQGVNELVIKLPRRSPKATYRITLADSFGKQALTSSAKLYAGTTVRTKWNLTSIKEGGYLLCVGSNDEVPDCVPVRIANR